MDMPENTLVAAPGEVYDEVQVDPVKSPNLPNWNIEQLAKLAEGDGDTQKAEWLWDNWLGKLSQTELFGLRNKWSFWARPNQLAPKGDWTFWLLLAGRGFGKTRTGAEWINERVEQGKAKRIALVAPTAADVRKVMVEGESGLLAVSPPWNRPLFEPSKLQLTWPNGAIAQLFSAEEPERLRGPQCDTFWADELAAWTKLQETWDMLQFGFRLGTDPRGCITTTPKPLPIVKQLVADDRNMPEEKQGKDWGGQCAVTRGSTYDNRANLAPQFFSQVVKKYEGTRLGRQELEAQILEDMPGALWSRPSIDTNRIPCPSPHPTPSGVYSAFPQVVKIDPSAPFGTPSEFETAEVLARAAKAITDRIPEDLVRIVVAVDPNVSNTEGSDEIGITVQGKGMSGRGYLLADCSMRGSPNEWASAAVLAHDAFKADQIIGEANQGGNMVEHTITSAAKALKTANLRKSDFVGVTLVHATRGKVTRAEPVSSLYEQNRISHVGSLPTIEDQMCLFTSDFDRKSMGYSPDRVDALVWGFTHLFHEQQDGSGIFDFIKNQAAQAAANKAVLGTEDWVRMVAPMGISTAYGREGDKYTVDPEGMVLVKPIDAGPLSSQKFQRAPVDA